MRLVDNGHDPDEEYDDEYIPDDESHEADPTAECPYCHKDIYDDAEWCPKCGKYLSRIDRPLNRPLWFAITAVICVIVVLLLSM